MSTEIKSTFDKANDWQKRSITLRVVTIVILILLLLIPVNMVQNLIEERQSRHIDAIDEISSKWGGQQTITGLVLSVPYKNVSKVYEGENEQGKYKMVETVEYAHFLPEELLIKGNIAPEKRYRGIYEVIVYNSKVKLSGKFTPPNFDELKIDSNNVLWDGAFISLGLSDLKGVQDIITLNWNEKQYSFNPGVESADVIETGMSTRIPAGGISKEKNEFSLDLNVNGSSSLNFVPLGKETVVNINSNWSTPSFVGSFLPDNRKIVENGFTADWKVLHLNRPFPQSFKGATEGIGASSFGVSLIVPVDEYQKSMRSAKYAILFISLTFLIFFFVQILNGVRIHPIQYIIVGLALCVFYTLLIALSEQISYNLSYLVSSVSIIGLITLYAKSMFDSKRITTLIGLILTSLYLFVFTIIQMEDYALLMGSIALFFVVAAVMYLSRKIDWYAVKTN